jgi:uncharacterized repeat protein (TIGR01451 family)/fimbrial isopeptide formation D2 family protein
MRKRFITRYPFHELVYAIPIMIALALLALLLPGVIQAQSNPQLTVIDTSEAYGDNTTLAIGEVATYRFTFDMAEGSSTSVNAVVNVPDGLQYIAGSASTSVTNDTGWTATPTVSGGGSSGADITFDFGTITNGDSDGNTETIEIQFELLANNSAANQAGVSLDTTVTLSANGSVVSTSAASTVTIAEPDLAMSTDLTTTYTGEGLILTAPNDTTDAGDEFNYRVRITNNGSAPAYDVQLTAFFSADHVQQFGTLITTGGGFDGSSFAANNTTGEWTFRWIEIEPGQTVAAYLRVRVRNEVTPEESWIHTADITYHSLPDDDGTNNNVPGNPGDADGLRNGDDGVGGALNDYASSATSDAVTVDVPTVDDPFEHPSQPLATDIFGSSYIDSTDDPNTGVDEHTSSNVDLTIGEEANILIISTFPEGTTESWNMINLTSPSGHTGGRQNRVLELLRAEVIHVGANLSGTGVQSVGTTFDLVDNVGSDGDNERTQLFFGGNRNVLNTPDNVTNDDDRYIIRLTVRVDDEDESGGVADAIAGKSNNDGNVVGNRLQYQYTLPDGSTRTWNLVADADVVEPDVTVSSSTSNGTDVDAGDTVQFVLSVENTGTAPAYNLAGENILPFSGSTALVSFSGVDAAASTCDDISGFSSGTSGVSTVTFNFDELLAGASCTIAINGTVSSAVTPNDTYTNSASVTSYDSRDNAADADNRTYSGGSGSSTMSIAEPGITQSYASTSEAHTDTGDTRSGASNADDIPLAIGEIIRYRLEVDLIEGTHNSLIVSDNLPTGMQALYDSGFQVTIPAAVTVGTAGLTSGATTSIYNSDGSVAIAGFNTGTADNLTLNFGTVANSNTDNGTDEIIVIEFNALLLNSTAASNDRGDQRDNTASLSEDAGNSNDTANTLHARAYEPQLSISKTVSPTSADAGDTITFELVIQNDNSLYGTAAFDLAVTDVLPAGFTDLAVISTPAGTTNNSTSTALNLDIASLAHTNSATIEYTARVDGSVTPLQDVVNTVNLTYTSLPGAQGTANATPGNSGDDDGERNGSGTSENDYSGSDTATVTVNNVIPTLALGATSESHSSNPQVAIGEVLSFDLSTAVPEGVINNLVLNTTLPDGLELVSGGVTLYTSNATSISFGDITGTVPNSTPGLVLPADAGGAPTDAGSYRYDSASRLLEVNIGDLTNSDDDAPIEAVIVRVTVVVANSADNNPGVTWSNEFSATVDGSAAVTSNTVDVTVTEPDITITKAINAALSNPTSTGPFDGGDTVVYDLVVSNASGTNLTDAFDLNITDALDADLSLDNVQFIGTISGTPSDNSTTGASGSVDVTISQLAPGESLTIRAFTTVQPTVVDGQSIINTASLTYTSLPGVQGTADATPGSSGDPDGERNGSGTSENDYSVSDGDSFTIAGSVQATTSIAATSESHTADSTADSAADPRPLAVGEVVTYRLVTQLPEVTLPDLLLTDVLAVNIELIPGTARISYSADNALSGSGSFGSNETTPSTPITPAFDNGTRELSFAVGEVVNNDNDAGAELLIIEFDAVVLNSGDNALGASWANSFSADVNNDSSAEATSNEVYAVLREPVVSIDKLLVSPVGPAEADAGDTVIFRLNLTAANSDPNHTDAFDISVSDSLDGRLILNSVSLSNDGGYAAISSDNSTLGAGGQLDLVVDTIRAGDTLELTINATVAGSVQLGDVLSNQASLTYTSLPGAQGTADATPGSSGDPDGERNGNGTSENDYRASDTVDTDLTIAGNLAPTKAIAATSESHTADSTADSAADPRPLAVGEVVTYRLVTQLPEVTLPDLLLTDVLAVNIELIPGTARISYSADNALSGSGSFGSNETTPSTPITPAFDNGTRELSFAVGEVVNNDNDAGAELLIIEFDAVVLNSGDNALGASWANSFSADVNNDSSAEATSNEVYAVLVQPELNLSKTRTDTGLVNVGDPVDFELTLSHAAGSSSDAFTVIISDTLPTAGMIFDSITGGTCSPVTTGGSPGLLTFSLPGLTLADGSCTIQYRLFVGSDVAGDTIYTNNAQATYATIDGNDARILPTGTSSADFTTLPTDLSISKTVTPASAEPGAVLTYTVQFTNTGFAANNVVITDTLPSEIAVQNVDSTSDATIANTVSNATSEIFEVDRLEDGEGGLITITARINTGLITGTLFTNSVSISAGETDADLSNNSASDTGVTVLNAAPVLAAIAPQTINETSLLTFTVSAADPNSDTLTYSLSGEPAGAAIDSASGLFSWTPTNAQGPGVYTFDVTVNDTGNLSDTLQVEVTVVDRDISYSVTVDPTSLLEGNTGSQPIIFTVTRSGATYAASQVDYSLDGSAAAGTDYNAPTGPISFAAGETSQTVTIDVLGDESVEADETISLTLTDGSTPSGGIASYTQQSASSTILDDDTTGIVVLGNTTLLSISEPDETASFTLVLTSQPAAPVIIALSNSNPAACSLSTTSVELDSTNWQSGVSVTVTAVDNQLSDGTRSCDIVSAPAVSSDAAYDGLDAQDITVNVLDDDAPGVRVSPISGDTSETGDTASFSVQLRTAPEEPVTLTLQSSDPSEGEIDVTELVFTASTWNISQTVVVRGVDDPIADGDQPYSIEIGNTQSASASYDDLPVDAVTVVNRDDDSSNVIVSDTSLSLSESDGSATVTITLTSQPTAPVILEFASSDLDACTVDPATIQVDPADWSDPVNITVGVVDNEGVGGERTCVISVTVVSDAPAYAASPEIEISVTIADEAPGAHLNLNKVYLPVIRTAAPQAAAEPVVDLVVTDVRLSPDQTSFAAGEPVTITVGVTNQGSGTSTQGFWVDLYLNPDPVPDLSTIPLRWDETCTLSPCQGIAWQVSEPLAAGETITLTSTVDSMDIEYSRWAGWFAAGTTDLYVYVDSWSTDGTNGAVLETDESNNRAELRGLQVTGENPATLSGLDAPLPPR